MCFYFTLGEGREKPHPVDILGKCSSQHKSDDWLEDWRWWCHKSLWYTLFISIDGRVFVAGVPLQWCEWGRHGRPHPTSGVRPASQPWTPNPGLTTTPSHGQRGGPPAGTLGVLCPHVSLLLIALAASSLLCPTWLLAIYLVTTVEWICWKWCIWLILSVFGLKSSVVELLCAWLHVAEPMMWKTKP